MTEETMAHIRDHAQQCYPLESCGLIIVRKGKERYWPCRNMVHGVDTFRISTEEYTAAADAGDVVKVVHSHPNVAPIPSQCDLVACEQEGLPWVIVNWPTGEIREFEPSGYVAPLIGRVFSHGVLDCYSLILDYYQRELGITLPDFERDNDWWKSGLDLYRDNFEKAGFTRIDEVSLRRHDVILMRLGANVTNHGAVYLGEGLILHHPMQRLSGRDPFGGMWQKISTHFLRHTELP